jgi:hypothetical protein
VFAAYGGIYENFPQARHWKLNRGSFMKFSLSGDVFLF